MTDMSSGSFERTAPASQQDLSPGGQPVPAPEISNASEPIGIVLEIAGSGSQIALDLQRLQECSDDSDPSVALAGQVGSQIKIRVGKSWLLASVRTQKQDSRTPGGILANIDFLGEGEQGAGCDEEGEVGHVFPFRRAERKKPRARRGSFFARKEP